MSAPICNKLVLTRRCKLAPGHEGACYGYYDDHATPPAAQTGGQRERLVTDDYEMHTYDCKRIQYECISCDCDGPAKLRTLLAALDRGAADATKLANAEQMLTDYATELQKLRVRYEAAERTVAGLVEHKAVILNALLTLHPRNEAHRVRLDAAERAVSALPESAAREERVRCDECRKDDWRYDDPDLLPACPHPVAPPAGAAAQTTGAGEVLLVSEFSDLLAAHAAGEEQTADRLLARARAVITVLASAPAPDARDAVVEAARVIARDYDDDRLVRPEAVRALRTALTALTPTHRRRQVSDWLQHLAADMRGFPSDPARRDERIAAVVRQIAARMERDRALVEGAEEIVRHFATDHVRGGQIGPGVIAGRIVADEWYDSLARLVGKLTASSPAPDARDAVVEAARRLVSLWFDDDSPFRESEVAVYALRAALTALTPTGGDDK